MFGDKLTPWKMDEKCRLSSVRQTKLTYVGFRAHVKLASRIVSYIVSYNEFGADYKCPDSTCLDRSSTVALLASFILLNKMLLKVWNTWIITERHEPVEDSRFKKHPSVTHSCSAWRLDKFWIQQDARYDFTADPTGIGDRSVHEISEV